MKVIEVTVLTTGDIVVQTKGFLGSSCLSASKFVEEALGRAVTERKTSEFFGVSEAQQEIRQ